MREDGFRFDCEFCETTVRADTAAALKERGTTHLEANHYADLAEKLGAAVAGEQCHNDCGYVFPESFDEVAGITCPDCDHDHFPAFVQQYLYWQIECE